MCNIKIHFEDDCKVLNQITIDKIKKNCKEVVCNNNKYNIVMTDNAENSSKVVAFNQSDNSLWIYYGDYDDMQIEWMLNNEDSDLLEQAKKLINSWRS